MHSQKFCRRQLHPLIEALRGPLEVGQCEHKLGQANLTRGGPRVQAAAVR